MQQRALICLLFAIIMIVYAIRMLPFGGTSAEQIFSWSWIAFALLVISGNGLQLLYKRRNIKAGSVFARNHVRKGDRQRG
ncbi:hypothetical protein GN156_03755 [bacterium LRH843]|nr:hypothetical protein [bacterium LRH843]